MFQDYEWWEANLRHVLLVFQGVNGCSNAISENEDGEDGSDISEGRERMENAYHLICR